jgi:hypothetical protein
MIPAKIAIIVLLVALLLSCKKDGDKVREPLKEPVSVSSAGETWHMSTIAGGLDVHRTTFVSQGMTYEVIYIRDTRLEMSALQMQVVNVTKDSLEIKMLR